MRTVTEKALLLLTLPLLLPWSAARAESCADTVQLLQQLYNNTVNVCPDGEPASSCSGITLRATRRAEPSMGQNWNAWDPNPQTVARGTWSFSYLRADVNFSYLAVAGNNGFIITPRSNLCPGQQPSEVQCSFPMDGWTSERSDRGCGDNSRTGMIENLCQERRITSGAAWLADFRSRKPPTSQFSDDQFRSQCAFDMAPSRGQAGRATAFATFLDAARQTNAQEFIMANELMLTNTQAPNILAFFYVDAAGRPDALQNQRDYLTKTGNHRPVIRIVLPRSKGERAQFFCDEQQMAFTGTSRSPAFCRPTAPVVSDPAQSAAQIAQVAQNAQVNQALQAAGVPPANASLSQQDQALQAAGVSQAAQAQAAVAAVGQKCAQYIEKAEWVERDEVGYGKGWSLNITPTACGRQVRADEYDAIYRELFTKYGNDPRWNEGDRAGTMYTQLICHAITVSTKPEWNIEPQRPNISMQAAVTLPYVCNPLPSDAGK